MNDLRLAYLNWKMQQKDYDFSEPPDIVSINLIDEQTIDFNIKKLKEHIYKKGEFITSKISDKYFIQMIERVLIKMTLKNFNCSITIFSDLYNNMLYRRQLISYHHIIDIIYNKCLNEYEFVTAYNYKNYDFYTINFYDYLLLSNMVKFIE